MTEEQLKTFVKNELGPFVQYIRSDSDGIFAQGPNNTYLAYYSSDNSFTKAGLYIAKFISNNADVIKENGELCWGPWPEELKVSLDDDDEIRRRVYNVIKRMKEIKNKARIKNIQKDF